MTDLDPLAILLATLAAFAPSATYYAVVDRGAATTGADTAATPTPAWKVGVELLRSGAVATALAVLVAALGVTSWTAAVPLGLAAWLAFPVVLLAGSVVWEGVAVGRAAVHAGDWLLKLLLVAVIVTVWR